MLSEDKRLTGLGDRLSNNRYVRKEFPASSTDQQFLSAFSSRADNSFRDAFERVDISQNMKAALEYAQYMDVSLRYLEDPNHSFELNHIDTALTASLVTEYVVKLLSLGSIEAIEFVPRLLQLITKYPDAGPIFKRIAPKVPSWMFIRWTSQLTALLDSDLNEYVFLILREIVHAFPSAVYFPLAVSSESFIFSDGQTEERRHRAKVLQDIARSELSEILAMEIERLGDPVLIFKSWVESINALRKEAGENVGDAIQVTFSKMKSLIISSDRLGKAGRDFTSKHGKKILELCGISFIF
jgi:DNA-dependent protein kinase catalytic subunit